jgi:hypothetical protein
MARLLHVLVGGILLLTLAGAADAARARTPSLSLVRASPSLVVRGAHFAPSKRIRLILNFDGTRTTKLVHSNTNGGFVAALTSPSHFDACSDSFVVLAIPSTGERATMKFVPRECPPAP